MYFLTCCREYVTFSNKLVKMCSISWSWLLIFKILCLSTIFQCFSEAEAEGPEKLLISLNSSPIGKEFYGEFSIVNRSSTLEVNVSSTNNSISFIIFQAHSHLYNITLYQNVISVNTSINGTNLGLYSPINPEEPIFFIYNPNEIDVRIYISIHGYGFDDPVPGGCNMEFPILVSPFLPIHYTPDSIMMDMAPAQSPREASCSQESKLQYEVYRLYLPVRDFSAATYFDGIKKMLTIDRIMENGDLVPKIDYLLYSKMRTYFANYPGTGSIYAVIVVDVINNTTSTYVPAHSYGCSLVDQNDSCALLDDNLSKILCAIMLFAGIFLCYMGHRFFKTEMFMMGMASGIIVTYILIAVITSMDRPGILGASLLSGIFFGAIWWIYWWYYSIPFYAVMVPSLNVAFLLTSAIFFTLKDGNIVFATDLNYWVTFVFLLVATSLTLVSVTYYANLFCCAVLGSFAIIYPMDFYLGSNLKYIVVNVIRRASVPKFNAAVLAPPYTWEEALLTVMWIGLALIGFLFQHYLNRGKPPFPPPPRSTRAVPRDLGTYGSIAPGPWYRRTVPQGGFSGTVIANDRTPLLA